jgi:transposase
MRLRIEAILWIMRTGSPWRDLPASFGRWKSVYDRFRAWTETGLWTAIWDALSARSRDDEYLMIDSTAMRVHAHGANPAGGQLAQAMGRSKASLSTKVHMACDALGYPLGFILTGANVSDFDQAKPLLKRHLKPGARAIMDKGYDSDPIRAYVNQLGGIVVIALPRVDPQHQPLTSISIANVTASKTSSPNSNAFAASPLVTKNYTQPSPPCSPSRVSSFGSNLNQTHPSCQR